MLGTADVRDIVAAELGIQPELIGYDDDLVGLGMHSMLLMRLAGRWRKQGHDVRSSELALQPTIAAWAELLGASADGPPPAPVVESEPAAPVSAEGEEFPLATMQHAYWVGRRQDQRLGGVAAHLYVEFDGHGLAADRTGMRWSAWCGGIRSCGCSSPTAAPSGYCPNRNVACSARWIHGRRRPGAGTGTAAPREESSAHGCGGGSGPRHHLDPVRRRPSAAPGRRHAGR